MSARNLSLQQHLDAGQLPMYMTGSEIKKHYGPSERESHESDKDLWDRKLKDSQVINKGEFVEDSKSISLYDSIKKHGVQTPVEISGMGVWDGHHRVAAAAHGNPKSFIPLEHL